MSAKAFSDILTKANERYQAGLHAGAGGSTGDAGAGHAPAQRQPTPAQGGPAHSGAPAQGRPVQAAPEPAAAMTIGVSGGSSSAGAAGAAGGSSSAGAAGAAGGSSSASGTAYSGPSHGQQSRLHDVGGRAWIPDRIQHGGHGGGNSGNSLQADNQPVSRKYTESATETEYSCSGRYTVKNDDPEFSCSGRYTAEALPSEGTRASRRHGSSHAPRSSSTTPITPLQQIENAKKSMTKNELLRLFDQELAEEIKARNAPLYLKPVRTKAQPTIKDAIEFIEQFGGIEAVEKVSVIRENYGPSYQGYPFCTNLGVVQRFMDLEKDASDTPDVTASKEIYQFFDVILPDDHHVLDWRWDDKINLTNKDLWELCMDHIHNLL